ncbi:hypothetical protein C0J52_23913 [Blattella germanica]|nr:hypothetical protein C0J52_23913 [Blattella germanica]
MILLQQVLKMFTICVDTLLSTFNYYSSNEFRPQLSHKDLIAEVNQQTVKATRISGFLNDIIWNNKYLPIEPKVRIYKTIVRPILTVHTVSKQEQKPPDQNN